MEQTDRTGEPIPFSIEFVTADERHQTGGDVMRFEKARLCFPNKSGTRKFNPKKQLQKIADELRQGKQPAHVTNGTINLDVNGVITKCSIWLIRRFNNEQVTLHIHG